MQNTWNLSINSRKLILSSVNYYALVAIIALWMKLASSEHNVSYFSIRLTFLTELKKMFKEKFMFIRCNVRNSCHFLQLWDKVHLCFEIWRQSNKFFVQLHCFTLNFCMPHCCWLYMKGRNETFTYFIILFSFIHKRHAYFCQTSFINGMIFDPNRNITLTSKSLFDPCFRILFKKAYYVFFLFFLFHSVFLCGFNASYHRQCSYYFCLRNGQNTFFKNEIDILLKRKRTQQDALQNRWTTTGMF